MRPHIFILLAILFTTSIFAQIRFEAGYYIDNQGKRQECLIRNLGWNNNPREIEYRMTAEDQTVAKTIDEITEFGIGNNIKYVRADVDLDRSSEMLQSRTKFKEPVFTNERLLLKVIFQSKNTLYSYYESGLQRYYYKSGDKILPLIHKAYTSIATPENKQEYPEETRYNNTFRVQLWKDIKCPNTNMKRVEKVEYNEKSLLTYFREINNC